MASEDGLWTLHSLFRRYRSLLMHNIPWPTWPVSYLISQISGHCSGAIAIHQLAICFAWYTREWLVRMNEGTRQSLQAEERCIS